ncbi:hypothetical protein [uncultured Clostridium sp.]|uniref:hypothetical protein n=1 Tax=uncultured Clostridium sp. TaxID=59620 RepID=UPI00262ABF4B|nr:hypothetical protein [uncultured Clostridium sp.]
MNEKNIYLKNQIQSLKNNEENSLSAIIKLFEPYLRILCKNKGNYIYDELVEELISLILSIDLDKANLFGYLKVCLKNYYLKLLIDQNKKVVIDELQNILFIEDDFIDTLAIDEKIEHYLTNKDLFNKLLPNSLTNTEKLLVTEYFINHKTIFELMEMTSQKKSTIYRKLHLSKKIIENYVLKEVLI